MLWREQLDYIMTTLSKSVSSQIQDDKITFSLFMSPFSHNSMWTHHPNFSGPSW